MNTMNEGMAKAYFTSKNGTCHLLGPWDKEFVAMQETEDQLSQPVHTIRCLILFPLFSFFKKDHRPRVGTSNPYVRLILVR